MSTDFDHLLRDTLHGLAERAPDESAVRAALGRRRRPAFALIAVAASVLLVAVTIPLLRVGGPADLPPAGFTQVAAQEVTFPMEVTWLPPGLTEQGRGVSAGGTALSRHWHTGPLDADGMPDLTLHAMRPPLSPSTVWESVDLGANGTGFYAEEEDRRILIWNTPEWAYQLDSRSGFAGRETIVRVAAGVRPGRTTPLRTSLEFGDSALVAPSVATYGVRGSATGAPIPYAIGQPSSDGYSRTISAELTEVEPDIGEVELEVTVRGQPARFATHRPTDPMTPTETLAVDMGGRWLVVRNYAEAPDLGRLSTLVHVAETMRIAPTAPNEWIGTR
ncbi:hypothetical protein [Actinokineospora fastidiosa]|uniref:Uncharacterized protein n=1 Tax=Actinokineospora fastidiosa TaxID=1816 RepID=A0A918GAR1_9PSEU|nr:hypothetical protein [Actinokineospora fastidiosa]GGS25976.1 hypothetical protein GCM10010171_19210 [Actinokineospora fastidiosa]